MGNFILNIVHRPELMPEYSQKIVGHGKNNKNVDDGFIDENLDIFKTQQELAHRNGLKTTIQMTYSSLFNDEAINIAKEHHLKYGDEISLSLLGLPCKEFNEKYKTKDFCIWMFSMEDKQRIVDDVFEKFYEKFKFYPQSTGSYYIDADLMKYIKQKYPSVKCAIATCWEEGPKAYHTCNNSWYTLFDGGPWNPWIPSKQNIHTPAEDESDDMGVVAIPHLSRDLMACFDGNGSNFGTHPQNVLRGMIYDTETWEYPYLYNLIDQYRSLEKYNNGESYNMMFVGPGWMNKMGRWEAPYELLLKSYDDAMKYYGELKSKGKLIDMTMAEYADYYREKHYYKLPECALWKDILYGSNKQYFWYVDPYMRICLDMNQGGAIIDLRPYAAKLNIPVGIGTKNIQNASYPFLIQANYRAGYFTHYAGEGTIKSLKVSYKGESVDTCLCRTEAEYMKENKTHKIIIKPVDINFQNLEITLQTIYEFVEGSSKIKIIRKILKSTNTNEKVMLDDYITATYGTTEYPEDMSNIKLILRSGMEIKEISYKYKCRDCIMKTIDEVSAIVPEINTKVYITARDKSAEGYFREGYAFSPMFTLGVKKELKEGEVLETWLNLEKAH